jgi:XrtN system VIT domain protein
MESQIKDLTPIGIPLPVPKRQLLDGIAKTGLVFLGVSLVFFCCSLMFSAFADRLPPFIPCYALTVIYGFTLLGTRSDRVHRKDGYHYGIFLLLFLVSAYGLNRTMGVFDDSPVWFCVLLLLMGANFLSLVFFNRMPYRVKCVMCFMLGVSACTFLYLTIYLAPVMIICAFIFWVIGIPMHAFVPLLFFIYTVRLTRRYASRKTYLLRSFWSGVLTVAIIFTVYIICWSLTVKGLNQAYYDTVEKDKDLPSWAGLALHVSDNMLTKQVLKAGIVYDTMDEWGDIFHWTRGSFKFDEQKTHDPLVLMGSIFAKVEVPEEDRIRVLASLYDSRHQAQERLWSGNDLSTGSIETTAEIWPALHLAYMEKLIRVNNNAGRNEWPQEQEAIYTFQLPEGAVVTSLSLWINHHEEKGVLTTKGKAEGAYEDVVGQQRRDPSVVHWQEGNTVTVRVFPVASGDFRTFKIGLTMPLEAEGGRMVLHDLTFKGPSAFFAGEKSVVKFNGAVTDVRSSGLSETSKGYQGGGDFSISFKDDGIRPNVFSFNNQSYSIGTYKPQMGVAAYHDVYLDVNKAWSLSEYNDVLALFPNTPVWVFKDGLPVNVTDKNEAGLFNLLHKQRFSLLPIYELADPATALIVTNSPAESPSIADLEGGTFPDKLSSFLALQQKPMLFNIGGRLSPYLQSLKECRAFRYEQGDLATLSEQVHRQLFPINTENAQRINIESAGITISRTPGEAPSTAPDHLQRLFAYNHILQQMGPRLLSKGDESDSLVDEAKAAYVVTPLSSLIVLETQADYDKFSIKDSDNSLKNASIYKSGAAPEPHEWALILIVVASLIYVWRRKKLSAII